MKKSKFKLFSLLVLALNACSGFDGPEMADIGPHEILAEVRLRSKAIMIAKGDSLKIGFNLVAMDGSEITYDPTKIQWTSSQGVTVSVSSSGVILARQVSATPIKVMVKYVHNYVTRADTVDVFVTDGQFDVDELRLVSLDSNRVGGSGYGIPRVRVDLYRNGVLTKVESTIPIAVDPPIKATLNKQGGPDKEPVYMIDNSKIMVGTFWIRASLNLYGNEVNDSLKFTGLYSSLSGGTVYSDHPEQIPVLDTTNVGLYQLCTIHLLMNFSNETVDWLYSDSLASETGCSPDLKNTFASFGLWHGEFIGGNVLNVPPGGIAVRRSNTSGIIVATVRNSITKAVLPWYTYHVRQLDVE